jgi:hypothetical protein
MERRDVSIDIVNKSIYLLVIVLQGYIYSIFPQGRSRGLAEWSRVSEREIRRVQQTQEPTSGKGLCPCSSDGVVFELGFPPDAGRGGTYDPDYIMSRDNRLRCTPLHFALCCGDESSAIFLLERGANPHKACSSRCVPGNWDAIHTATQRNHRKVIDYLLDNNLAGINERGHEGLTPLFIAYYEEHNDLVNMYREGDADINAVWNSEDGGWTLFGMACLREDFSMASKLLLRGADPNLFLKDREHGTEWSALGLVYGNLYELQSDHSGWPYDYYPGEIHRRRMLEQRIIQAQVDMAFEQRRKDSSVRLGHRRTRSC